MSNMCCQNRQLEVFEFGKPICSQQYNSGNNCVGKGEQLKKAIKKNSGTTKIEKSGRMVTGIR
jgi:hypothetical protein